MIAGSRIFNLALKSEIDWLLRSPCTSKTPTPRSLSVNDHAPQVSMVAAGTVKPSALAVNVPPVKNDQYLLSTVITILSPRFKFCSEIVIVPVNRMLLGTSARAVVAKVNATLNPTVKPALAPAF